MKLHFIDHPTKVGTPIWGDHTHNCKRIFVQKMT